MKFQYPFATQFVPNQGFVLQQCASTNDVLKQRLLNNQPPVIIRTLYQTAGRGRRNRSWHSPPNTSLMVSMPVFLPPHAQQFCTLVAGLAVQKALSQLAIDGVQIKWPNDLLLNHKKVAGILSERFVFPQPMADQKNYIILGIGMNISNDQFPDELSNKASSLLLETGKHFAPELVLKTIIKQLEQTFTDLQTFGFQPIKTSWQSVCACIKKEIWINKESAEKATIVGLSNNGWLLIEEKAGQPKELKQEEVPYVVPWYQA